MTGLNAFVCFMGVAAAWAASFLIAFCCKSSAIGRDSNLEDKPQRMHVHQVGRLGGLGIVFGLAVYAVLSTFPAKSDFAYHEPFPVWVVFVGLPVFLLGIMEDFTGAVSPKYRLYAAIVSAFAACYFLQAILPLGNGSKWVKVGMIIFSAFCVAGLVNAFNIIDGLNGLSSGVAVVAFGLMGWGAHQLGDLLLVQLAVGAMCAVIGFMLVNYPNGRLFLGDGGAYLIGFLIAELAILLVVRHPAVSWFFPLACVIYPVTETLFSIYRRKIKKGNAQQADALHLHSLIHRRLNHWRLNASGRSVLRNSLSTTFFWSWQLLSAFVLVLIWESQFWLIGYCLLQAAVYLGLYRMITRFRVPRWMRLVSARDAIQTEFGFANFPQNTPIQNSDVEEQNKTMTMPKSIPKEADKQFELWSQ